MAFLMYIWCTVTDALQNTLLPTRNRSKLGSNFWNPFETHLSFLLLLCSPSCFFAEQIGSRGTQGEVGYRTFGVQPEGWPLAFAVAFKLPCAHASSSKCGLLRSCVFCRVPTVFSRTYVLTLKELLMYERRYGSKAVTVKNGSQRAKKNAARVYRLTCHPRPHAHTLTRMYAHTRVKLLLRVR